jgi:diguanylate cyclase (GGDEF)-like protein
MGANILLIDDEPLSVQILEKALTRAGYQVTGLTDPVRALTLLDKQAFDLVITDIEMPRVTGIKVLEMVKALDETIEVVLITAAEQERFENAIAALRLGASDFLTTPLRNMDEVLLAVEKALEKRKLALTVRQLSQSLERIRNIDFLTGVSTRRYFFDRVGLELMRAKRYRKPISCFLVDIDLLGQINGTYGIACGDQVLSQVAQVLRDAMRATDIVGRYGGEEFIVALVETKPDQAQVAAEKVRRAVEERKFTFGAREITVTVSVGVAGAEEATSIADLVALAGQALEEAKRSGRNCVRAAQAGVRG